MSGRVEVKPEAEFDEGDHEIIEANGRSIGVIRYGGEFYALSNTCLHDCGPVCTGRVHEKMTGEHEEPGQPLNWYHDEDEVVISCPWHGWTYDVESGKHIGDDSIQLPTYDVIVKDGMVYVETDLLDR
ncbi:Rieske 2Fe-2S domain-containing protein [Haloarcula sp. JP-L23]|uniref:Rieske (2Fe-2S) protein n=1 Tax=Haloarcula sp. JP-L23 TaxID=2716717 RepID=UPI00140F2708|nr:Rieske 2Fe-2S domain-containing protein [Haloarcula sp. JP-L23]